MSERVTLHARLSLATKLPRAHQRENQAGIALLDTVSHEDLQLERVVCLSPKSAVVYTGPSDHCDSLTESPET